MKDYYEVLQVHPSADAEVIESAYRRLSRKYHPDVNPNPDATARMQELNEAWSVLGDPAKRREYDRGRVGNQSPPQTKRVRFCVQGGEPATRYCTSCGEPFCDRHAGQDQHNCRQGAAVNATPNIVEFQAMRTGEDAAYLGLSPAIVADAVKEAARNLAWKEKGMAGPSSWLFAAPTGFGDEKLELRLREVDTGCEMRFKRRTSSLQWPARGPFNDCVNQFFAQIWLLFNVH